MSVKVNLGLIKTANAMLGNVSSGIAKIGYVGLG
jgi:hypothetical protein